jgi:putative tryptophan/tyrosine transport system substrate-binding protein
VRRRTFAALLCATPLAWQSSARAQPAVPVVGYLAASTVEQGRPLLPAFHDGLKEAGYVEGRNVAITFRYAAGQTERLPALAAELVELKVAVIVTATIQAAVAARNATLTIPIVFLASNPVELGLVASLNRPGGNATGVNILILDLIPKRLELLREMIPGARSVVFLVNPANPSIAAQVAAMQAAARVTGHDVQILEARNESEIEQAFARFAERPPDALLTGTDPLFFRQRDQIVALAARHAIPAIYEWPDYVATGGLASYGPSVRDAIRLVGAYTGKILAGASPAELPVQQATTFELAINLKAAKALGLAIPPSLLTRADEVIE